MKVVILAGGGGTRLWPMSRESFPKQFLNILGKDSLLQATVKRALLFLEPKDIYVVTLSKYLFLVQEQLKQYVDKDWSNIILEPMARNTAAAMALAMVFLKEQGQIETEPIIFCPADHIIPDGGVFVEMCQQACVVAQKDAVVLFGVTPNRPETGYGYIKKKAQLQIGGVNCFTIERFAEKPDAILAAQYVSSGDYVFNSGIFTITSKIFWQEVEKYAPKIKQQIAATFEKTAAAFNDMPMISFDHAVMEHTDKGIVIPFIGQWSDVGAWNAVWELAPKDLDNNNIRGNIVCGDDVKNCFLWSDEKLVVALGLENTLVVSTEDAVLVAAKECGQQVKDVVAQLEQGKYHKIALEHPTIVRPWGSYTILGKGDCYKVKRITVTPGCRLSLQKHIHRSEHWTVVHGTAKVFVDGKEMYLRRSESIYVPALSQHRLENPGKVLLEIIEVQTGEYLEEDDIERILDDYRRD